MEGSMSNLIQAVLTQLQQEGYTEKGIKKHTRTYSLLMSYADQIGQHEYSEELGQTFVKERYGASFDTRRGNNSEYVTEKIRHLEKLWHFKTYGTILFAARSGKKKPFQCPTCFAREYEMFLAYCEDKGYTDQSRRSIIHPVRKFLVFLDVNRISSLDAITAETVTGFMSVYIDCSKVYLKSLALKLDVFFRVLHENHLVSHDLSLLLPRIRYVRDAFIPSSWAKEDVIKLMLSIDRSNPIGKRDYAMLLIVIRLGLRTVDIHSLKLTDFDWTNRKIRIVQTKTREPLELPLLEDVGWAVIDYLKNGRPQSEDHTLFIRHSPEGGPISERNKLEKILHKHMRIAGLEIPKNEHRGLHSLRSSLARTMLESGASLPTISEVLGHRSTQSTSHYLKINRDALRKCAIDPEEVFLDE
jgi:integrase/recombinase XerD